MGHIYTNAEQMLIWLGSGNQDTSRALGSMKTLVKHDLRVDLYRDEGVLALVR